MDNEGVLGGGGWTKRRVLLAKKKGLEHFGRSANHANEEDRVLGKWRPEATIAKCKIDQECMPGPAGMLKAL